MGLATAQLLSSRGAIISLADINQQGLEAAVKSLKHSEKHISTVIDVRRSQSVDDWITSTVQKLGRLDGAVNMAGVITPATPITEVKDDDWNFSFDVNARGVFYCVRAQLRVMGDGASIVSVHIPNCTLPHGNYILAPCSLVPISITVTKYPPIRRLVIPFRP